MKANTRIAASAFALAMAAMATGLQAEALEEVSDHPLVPRTQDSEVIAYDYVEFGEHVIPWGSYSDGAWEETIEVEGSHERFAYVLPMPDIRPLPLSQAYKSVLGLRGFDIEFHAIGRNNLPDDFSQQDHFHHDFDGQAEGAAYPDSDLDSRRFFGALHEEEGLYVTVFIHENVEDEPVILVNIVEPQ